MSRKIKINKLTVAQYMQAVNDPQAPNLTEEEQAILSRFEETIRSCPSYSPDATKDTYARNSFIAIIVMLQYLNDDNHNAMNAMESKALFRKHQNIKTLNEFYLRNTIFLISTEVASQNHIFDKVVNRSNDAALYTKLFNEMLKGCTKDSTIDTVLRCLEPFVRLVALDGFREMARQGFDVDLSVVPGPLWDKCAHLYDAGAKQIVFTGAPGTGKTYTAYQFARQAVEWYYGNSNHLKTHIEIVQFHSSYDYSDFVEGLRPVETGENGEVTFRRLDGQFKAFCRKILKDIDSNAPYFFIIDEINRADLSRVFGELMFCLDESKRPVSLLDTAGKMVNTQYSNLPTYEVSKETGKAAPLPDDIYRDGFYIPKNLCILATMNDIDRSIETFDFALRRRFKWIEAKANDEMECGLQGILGRKVPGDLIQNLTNKAREMNDVIAGASNSRGESLRLTTAYHIGHAYFEKFNGENLQDIWDTQIEQILREYCRGRSNASQVEEFINSCHDALFENTKKN